MRDRRCMKLHFVRLKMWKLSPSGVKVLPARSKALTSETFLHETKDNSVASFADKVFPGEVPIVRGVRGIDLLRFSDRLI